MGVAIDGQHPVVLEASDGQLDVEALLGVPCPATDALRARLLQTGVPVLGRIALPAWLVATLGRTQRSCLVWFVRQLLHWMGLALEQWAKGLAAERAAPPADVRTAGQGRRVDLDAARAQVLGGRFVTGFRKHGELVVATYFMAIRRWLHQCQSITVAVDASRVGAGESMVGVIGGWWGGRFHSAWAPPQVAGGGTNPEKF